MTHPASRQTVIERAADGGNTAGASVTTPSLGMDVRFLGMWPAIRRAASRLPVRVPLLLVLAGLAALAIDLPVASWFREEPLPRELTRFLNMLENVGNGLGVLLFALAVWFLDPRRRRVLPTLLCCSWGAGLAANVVKLLLARYRPLADFTPSSVWDTFQGFLPPLGTVTELQSFPSAHSATAVGLAIILVRLYRRGWPLFVLLGAGVCFQRITWGAHYPSDVLFAAAIGWFIAGLSLQARGIWLRYRRARGMTR